MKSPNTGGGNRVKTTNQVVEDFPLFPLFFLGSDFDPQGFHPLIFLFLQKKTNQGEKSKEQTRGKQREDLNHSPFHPYCPRLFW